MNEALSILSDGLKLVDQKSVYEFYLEGYHHYGFGWCSLGWSSLKTQTKRFEVLCEIADLQHGDSVIDLGCGYGDLFAYLQARELRVNYTGCDLIPVIVDKAKEKYPTAAFFQCDATDVGNLTALPLCDFVFSSGTFNVDFGDNQIVVEQVIENLLPKVRKGIAINFLSTSSKVRDETFVYYEPTEMFAFAKTLTDKVKLKKGYLPNDFTIFLGK